MQIYIFTNKEYFGSDFTRSIEWHTESHVNIKIGLKSTVTTDDARQLSIS